jgi:hypothetical protein
MVGVVHRRQVIAATLAAVAAGTTDGAYLAAIRAQGAVPPETGVVPFVTGYIAAIAAATLIGLWFVLRGRPTIARTVFLAAAAGSGALGFLAIFSIGIALVVTAVLLLLAAQGITTAGRPMAWLWPLSGALFAVVVLIVGFFAVGTF